MKKAGRTIFISTICALAYLIPSPFTAQETPKFLYGVASWYGDDFEGKPTASGEPFSMRKLTAAHKTLPFGTMVEVENLSNGKKVVVRINDRGPFAENRLIDLSKQAAEVLDYAQEGTTFVKATILEMGDPVNKKMNDSSTPNNTSKDIPKGFDPAPPAPAAISTNNIKDETAFMDDTPLAAGTKQNSPVRAQQLPDPVAPKGFVSNNYNPEIDDPLGDIQIDPNDEFEAILGSPPTEPMDENMEDPFADLYNNDPYNIQDGINFNTSPKGPPTDNIGTSGPAPVSMTNIIQDGINSNTSPKRPPTDNIGTDPLSSEDLRSQTSVTKTNIVYLTNTITDRVTETNIVLMNPDPSYDLGYTPEIEETNTLPNGIDREYYVIQLGAFSNQKYGYDLYRKLRDAKENVFTTDIKIKNKNLTRVRVGYFTTLDAAIEASQRLEKQYNLANKIVKIDYIE